MPTVMINPDKHFSTTYHPSEPRLIRSGDVFPVDKISETSGWATYKNYNGKWESLIDSWFTVVETSQPRNVAVQATVCTCPINVLMGQGCQCGGI